MYKKRMAKEFLDELKIEIDAANDYFERTGKSMHILSPTEQRKLIENWKEDHQ